MTEFARRAAPRSHRLPVFALALLLGTAATAAPALQALPAGTGLSNPALAFGLAGLSDYSSEMPFLNLVKMMRPWRPSGPGQHMTYADLAAGGYLDPSGYVTHMPPGIRNVRGIWAWGNSKDDAALARSRAGVYVLRYAGSGQLRLGGNVKVLGSAPGRITFENTNGGTMWIDIAATDPGRTGDYIRDISVVARKYEGLYQTGEIFNPDWLSVIDDARELRFMDWMGANGTNSGDWADRGRPANATWVAGGPPVEVMVQLANQVGADPWFTLPKEAGDDYVRNFATYVRDHLNPGLVAHVEYANEAWNARLKSYHWFAARSQAAWGKKAPFDYFAMRATQVARICDQVFAGKDRARLDNVLATQAGNAWISAHNLVAPVWKARDPAGYVAPYSVFNALAVTTYFGAQTLVRTKERDALVAAIRDPSTDAADWLKARLLDPDYDGSIPKVAAKWAEQKKVAQKYGLKLVAYEGGQHVFQAFQTRRAGPADTALLIKFMTGFVRSPQMADLYGRLWNDWAQIGDGPFMQYSDVSAAGKYGSWGLLSALGDSNPRAALLAARNASDRTWFGTGGGPQYQQGVIRIAGNLGETLTGTAKDDYLVGGAGNDVLIPGTGRNGVNGGGGSDTLVLAGAPGDWTLAPEGPGYRLTGPGTSDYVVNVGTVRFDGGVTESLARMKTR